jgi:hypothetical protein
VFDCARRSASQRERASECDLRCYCHRSLAGEVGRGGVLSLFFFSFHAFFQPCNAVD